MKKNNRGLYTVGEMSALCGIPARQLRYYDQIGVVRPDYRDPETKYRYYTDDQIEQFLFLKNMRNIGISNESIQRLFINRDVDQLVQELQLNLTQVEQEILDTFARYRKIIDALVLNTRTLAYLHGNEAISSPLYSEFWISIVKFPNKRILSMRYTDDAHSANRMEYVHRVAELNQVAAANQLSLDETRMTIYRDMPIDRLCADYTDAVCAYEIAQEIKDRNAPCPAEYADFFGGFNALSTVNVGGRETRCEAYCALRKWAENRRLELADIAIEEYLADSFITPDENRYVTKIYIPLKSEERAD